jgi:hypothetical protein
MRLVRAGEEVRGVDAFGTPEHQKAAFAERVVEEADDVGLHGTLEVDQDVPADAFVSLCTVWILAV